MIANTFNHYWGQNWPGLISLVTVVLSPWAILGYMRTAGAKQERHKRTQAEIVTLIEAALARGAILTTEAVYEIAAGVASRYDVALEDVWKPVTLLRMAGDHIHSSPYLALSEQRSYMQANNSLIAGFHKTAGVDLLKRLLMNVQDEKQGPTEILSKDLLDHWGTQEDWFARQQIRERAVDAVAKVGDERRTLTDKLKEDLESLARRWGGSFDGPRTSSRARPRPKVNGSASPKD